ncbi:MAG: hypothetical protein AB1656_20885 [Candidatus Omnitrophota bacterium]
MNNYKRIIIKMALFAAIACWTAGESAAQFFQGMGGMGGTGRSSSSSSSSSGSGYQADSYTPGRAWQAVIQTDPDTKSIIVIADEETNEHIRQIIEHLDKPVAQVLIKVVFLEVTHNDDLDFGIEGTIKFGGGQANTLQSLFGLAAETRGGFYKIIENDLEATMRAISEVGKLEVLSRPSIMTRSNEEAVITVGQEVPFISNSRITQDGQTINTVVYDDIGIILRVTPYISDNGLVEMDLSPEISTLTGETVPISDTIDAPVFAKRSAETRVVVPHGQTVVIGGMMEDNKTETVRKIPVLGDIPLLGYPFKRTIKTNSKTELLIFLTPYVVEGTDQLAEMTNDEKGKTELAPKVFSEQQINKFLEGVPARAEAEKPAEAEKTSESPKKPVVKEETVKSRKPSPTGPMSKIRSRSGK